MHLADAFIQSDFQERGWGPARAGGPEFKHKMTEQKKAKRLLSFGPLPPLELRQSVSLRGEAT